MGLAFVFGAFVVVVVVVVVVVDCIGIEELEGFVDARDGRLECG